MRYVKLKRERVGACTICKQCDQLTYDHIPPVIAGNADPVMLVSAITAISGQPQEDRPLISQNGYKIRSICRECNSAIGREYDPVIGKLCADINRYLASPLTLPLEATFETIPARLIRGLLAHLLAAKLRPDEFVVDQLIRDFLSDPTSSLASDWHVYYWLYPYASISVLRDFGAVLFTGTRRHRVVGSVMKFPPLSIFITDAKYFHGLPDLSTLSHFGIDDPGRVVFRFDTLHPADWPEGIEHSGFILMGEAGGQSLYGIPRNTA
jgi:hypothetical protein